MAKNAPTRRKGLLRRFVKSRKGTTMIEFGFIALPFFMMTIGTLEIALVHLMRSSINNAMELASRPIMTGQATCKTAEEFINDICSSVKISSQGGCAANTKVELMELNSYADDVSVDNTPFENRTNSMDWGQGDSTMLLRTFHRWNVMFPLLDDALGGGNGEVVFVTNVAFRNEPFGAQSSCTPPPPPSP